jgi:hypothetical protein
MERATVVTADMELGTEPATPATAESATGLMVTSVKDVPHQVFRVYQNIFSCK